MSTGTLMYIMDGHKIVEVIYKNQSGSFCTVETHLAGHAHNWLMTVLKTPTGSYFPVYYILVITITIFDTLMCEYLSEHSLGHNLHTRQWMGYI